MDLRPYMVPFTGVELATIELSRLKLSPSKRYKPITQGTALAVQDRITS